MNIEIEAIKAIVNEYEVDRKKKRKVGIILGIIFILISFIIMWKGDIKINLYSTASYYGVIGGVLFRYGSKKDNKHIEEIKRLLNQ